MSLRGRARAPISGVLPRDKRAGSRHAPRTRIYCFSYLDHLLKLWNTFLKLTLKVTFSTGLSKTHEVSVALTAGVGQQASLHPRASLRSVSSSQQLKGCGRHSWRLRGPRYRKDLCPPLRHRAAPAHAPLPSTSPRSWGTERGRRRLLGHGWASAEGEGSRPRCQLDQ